MKRIEFNQNYFENIDSEHKAYFLGFLMADGSVAKNRNKLTIKINNKDIEVLESFSKCVEFEGDIWHSSKRKDICEIGISSKKMKSDLINLGVHLIRHSHYNFPN